MNAEQGVVKERVWSVSGCNNPWQHLDIHMVEKPPIQIPVCHDLAGEAAGHTLEAF
jgi:hypothetical protein